MAKKRSRKKENSTLEERNIRPIGHGMKVKVTIIEEAKGSYQPNPHKTRRIQQKSFHIYDSNLEEIMIPIVDFIQKQRKDNTLGIKVEGENK